MESNSQVSFKKCVVVGAGISGIAAGRWLKHYNIDFVMLEKSNDIAGLWRYREDDYGVMDFTHINVSKYNYCFSDHPFPTDSIDYPHHTQMYNYVKSYAEKHSLYDNIQFNTEVLQIAEINPDDPLISMVTQTRNSNEKYWKISIRDTNNAEKVIVTNYVSIATGHHGVPLEVTFPGQETFSGEILHSVKFKSSTFNKMLGKRVLVVGIGNSGVDVAVNLYNEGRCPKVVVSTRSGAWVVPNYISGFATDLYATRSFLAIPWKVTSWVMEMIIKFIYGSPEMYNLNPKMKALAAQPTVSPTLIHHIQRGHIQIKSNVKTIAGSEVTFENGEKESFDSIIMCTGYKIGLSMLHPDLKKLVFKDNKESILNLYKQVFHPKLGHSLGFIGFAQPASGGLLTISEIQARWFVHLLMNDVQLPAVSVMNEEIEKDLQRSSKRYYSSNRHTIQQDPIVYNDEISQFYGAKPDYFKNFLISWRLLFSSCGPAQWRLNGPEPCSEAVKLVKTVPVTSMMKAFAAACAFGIIYLVWQLINNPLIFCALIFGFFMFKLYKHKKNQ